MAVNKDFVVKNGLQVGANTSIEGSITTVDSIQFDTAAGATPAQGQLSWNADAGTLDLGIDNDVTLQLGQETHIHVKAGEALSNGDVVYASGAVGNSGQIEVSKYIANGSIEEQTVVGIATQDIASGEFGYVTAFGAVRGLSTDGSALTTPETWTDGNILYASPTVAGELTSTLPEAPNQAIPIAFVTSAHGSNGTLFVRAYELGSHLGELHDVHITSPANNDILIWDTNRWVNSANASLSLGDLTVTGDLTITGNTTSVNTDNLVIEDLNIVLANGAANSSVADGAGITIDGANAQLTYASADDTFNLNKELSVTAPGAENSLTLTTDSTNVSAIRFVNDVAHWRIGVQGGDDLVIRDVTNTNNMMYFTPEDTISITAPTTFSTTATATLFSGNLNATTANTTTLNATTVNATTLNGAFGNTAVQVASAYPVTPATGNIWFDNLNLTLKVYDGTNWQDAVPSGGGGDANTATTDANATFAKYTYELASATSVVSGVDANGNTLSYDTSGIENVEVYVNGVKQVEGAGFDYTATTGSSIGFTTTLSVGDVVDIQVYELLTNDAYYLKTETYTQSEINSNISTAVSAYVPKTGGDFTGNINVGTISNNATLTAYAGAAGRHTFVYSSGYGGIQIAGTGASSGPSLTFANDYTNGITEEYSILLDGATDDLVFVSGDPSDVATLERMRLTDDGKLGLGTDPSYNLHVYKDGINADVIVKAENDQANYGAVFIADANSNYANFQSITPTASWIIGQRGLGGGNFEIIDGTSGTNRRLTIDSSGNVTITSGILYLNNALNLNSVASSIPGNGGIARLSNGYTYFTGKNNGNGTVLSNGDGTASIRAMNPGATAGYIDIETGNGAHVIQIDTNGNFIPQTTDQDLGSTTNPWQNIYTQDLVLSNEARPEGNEVDGTKGNWTIQEGEEHLYIINNKSGKKYKFALEEIE